MAKDQELLIRINGTAKGFSDEIEKAKAKTKDLEKSLVAVAKVSTAAFVGLSASVAGTVIRFSNFEKEFSNVVTLLDKGSFKTTSFEKGVKGLEEGILALRASSGQSFDALNKGLFDIISATGDAENAMGVLESATKLAIAGGTDVSTAVDGITTSIKAFGLETSDAQSVAEKFFQAQKGGKTTVAELSSSIGVAAATASAYNVSLNELLAASSAATLAGIKTNATFTGLKAVFASISKPTEDAKNEAARLGISFTSTALRAQGLEGFLKNLTSANGFTQKSIEKLFGSVEAQNVLFALTGKQAGDFANQLKLLGDQQNIAATFVDAYNVKSATTEKALARLTGALDAVAVTFGSQFAPVINIAADALAAIAQEFSKLDKSTIKVIAIITGVVTALTGLIATMTIATLGFLKVRVAMVALGPAFNIVRVGALKAITALRAATITVRGLAAATGIGLLLVALSYLATNFTQVKAIAAGSFAYIKKVADDFSTRFTDSLGGVSELLVGLFTFDVNKIKSGFNKAISGAKEGASKIGSEAAKAYNEAYDQSIKLSSAPQLNTAVEPPPGSPDAKPDKDAAQARLDAAKEEAAAALAIEDEKNAALRAKDEQEKADKLERERRQGENIAVIKEELQALDDEQRALLDEQDIQKFKDVNVSKDNIRRDFAAQALNDRIQARKKYIQDEIKHGKTVADLNAFFASQEVQLAQETGGKLVQLTQSKNATLKSIGKAASLTQIAIKTAEGAISAYSSLAGIPIVGPALGAVAAGALIAFGLEQASAVTSAQRGGIVPDGIGGSNDRIPALLQPGELVVPKPLAPDFIQSVGRPDGGGLGGGSVVDISIGFKDEAFEIIEEKLIERRRIEGRGLGALG